MGDKGTRSSEEDRKKLQARTTKVYMESVMQRVFKKNIAAHLEKLLSGDRATLDLCADHLSRNLAFFELLHTLCLITDQRFDLEHKEPAKAADAWLCWFEERKESLTWDKESQLWKAAR